MYFSSINNKELMQFHKIIPYNFNVSLSDALSSDLFYVETVIPNKLYRVFLLFYCDKITSSNSDDVILENKCIICNKSDDETYFNFISNDYDNIILNRLEDYYSFGDSLSDEEFNSIVQLLRVNNIFCENIQIKNSTVRGDYGTYVFNLKSTTIVDNGVLITNETLSSIGSVKLVNPTFKNSNYKLKLTVYSFSDINLCDESSSDNIVETELIIDLSSGSEVNIPFNTLDLNCIVGFSAVVIITHDFPVIQYPKNIILYSDKSECVVGDSVTLTASYMEGDSPLVDEEITFKNNDDVLGSASTDSSGLAVFSYVPVSVENLSVVALNKENKVISNTLDILVNKKTSSVSLNVSKNTAEIGEEFVISGVLSGDNELLANSAIKIFNGNNEFCSLITDSKGEYSESVVVEDVSSYDFKAVFGGDSIYKSCESSYVNVKGVKKSVKLIDYSSHISSSLGDTAYLNATLVLKDGTPLANANFDIKWVGFRNGVRFETIYENEKTNSEGKFRQSYGWSTDYIVDIYFIYKGTETIDELTRIFGW